MTETIAVYGTLRSGFGNNYLLQQAEAERIGGGITEAGFDMTDCGFPFAIPGGEDRIRAEVWSVPKDTIYMIDSLEGYPGWYDKQAVTVTLDDGSYIIANIYTMGEEEAGGTPVIPVDGVLDWAADKRKYG